MSTDELNKGDELVDVRLPRRDYEALREVLEREQAYSWIKRTLRSWWVFAVAGGIVTLITFLDTIKEVVKGIVK